MANIINKQPVKNYTISLMLSALHGKNKKLQFIGTKQEATNHAYRYIAKNHLAPQGVSLTENK